MNGLGKSDYEWKVIMKWNLEEITVLERIGERIEMEM
jgi:hypothetical protein